MHHKNRTFRYFLTAAILLTLLFGNLKAQNFRKTALGLEFEANNIETEIQIFDENIVRVIKSPAKHTFEKESFSVIKKPQKTNFDVKQTKDELQVSTQKIRLTLDLKTGQVKFLDKKGNVLLNEKQSGATFSKFNDAGTETFTVAQSFELDKEEAIYGLGILQNGKMSQRNQEVRMVQNNTWDFVTFFQSVKGYGLFWDNYSPTTFKDNANETSFTSEVGECVDYYFIYGGNADAVIANMRSLTGEVPMFPLWTYGYWQSKERYKSQNEIVGVVKKASRIRCSARWHHSGLAVLGQQLFVECHGISERRVSQP